MYNNYSSNNEAEGNFPEVYTKLMPVVDQVISEMEKQYGKINVNNEILNSMAEETVRRTGVEYNKPNQNADAIPTVSYGGHYGRNQWGYHNRDTLHDLARILLWSQIFGLPHRHRWSWHR